MASKPNDAKVSPAAAGGQVEMRSGHMVRKRAVADTAFNHQLHDLLEDDHSSDDSDSDPPEKKSQHFEFSDGYAIMRLLRLILYVQVIGIAMDNPSLEYAVVFRIACRGILFYSIRFYSRIFLDLLYVIQYFLETVINFFVRQDIPETPNASNVEVTTRRRLNSNPYSDSESKDTSATEFRIDITDERTWHSLKHYSQYFLGLFFSVMVVLFLLRFWEISDYSNRAEVKDWLHRYVADGWWRRGGLNVALSTAQGLLALVLLLLLANAIATQWAAQTIPEARVVGSSIAVGLSVVFIIWLLGCLCIRLTETAFVRYVSQNVSYTSAIILKRAVKAKLDLALLLMVCLYTPVVYMLVQACTMIYDWNDTAAPAHRKDVNYFVPCYYQAFPPYREQRLTPDTCSVAQYAADDMPVRGQGFYRDSNILSCDTLLAMVLYVVTANMLVWVVVGFFYVVRSMVVQVSAEFRGSRFVDILSKLMRIREEEQRDYNDRFTRRQRLYMATMQELNYQYKQYVYSIYWLFITLVRCIKGIIRGALKPVKLVVVPIKFLLERIFILSCFNYTTEGQRLRQRSQRSQRIKSRVSSRGGAASPSARSRSRGTSSSRGGLGTGNSKQGARDGDGGRGRGRSGTPAESNKSDTIGFSSRSAAPGSAERQGQGQNGGGQFVFPSPPHSPSQRQHPQQWDDRDDLSAVTAGTAGTGGSSLYRDATKGPGGGAFVRQQSAVSFLSNGISLDDAFLDEGAESLEEPFSFSAKIRDFAQRHSLRARVLALLHGGAKRVHLSIMRSGPVVWFKIQSRLLIHRYFSRQQTAANMEDEASFVSFEPVGGANSVNPHFVNSRGGDAQAQQKQQEQRRKRAAAVGSGMAISFAALGGTPAAWRIERTLHAKFRLLGRLKHHILEELRLSKVHFISDHDLLISVFDRTVDSAGMFTLVIPYDFHRLHFFLVPCVELTLYAVAGSVLNVAYTWQARLLVFLGIDVLFGAVTYWAAPYTEELDRWLEFMGRVMIAYVLIGTLVCASLWPDATDEVGPKLFEPWNSFSYVVSLYQGGLSSYELLDLTMVLFFYCYMFYVLYAVGVLGVVERSVKAFQFGYHDHVLDFLVDRLDQRCFGMENMSGGLLLVQQWDDILKLQRRYALLSWPDVRPPNLVPLSAKLLEIKWAALFNLTLKNLRSSLGLSLLHTSMFSADGDVARWIIHSNPELLTAEDSQNDTPITIALKECAYFLLAYGEQNGGALDDGTGYSDEQYAAYYPEVDNIRDDIAENGEFMYDQCVTHLLTSRDLIVLQEEGVYTEPRVERLQVDHAAIERAKRGDLFGTAKVTEEDLRALEEERRRKRKAKQQAMKAADERQSIYSKRFPEDYLNDSYETGQSSSWATLGMAVPEEQLFLDAGIVRKMARDPHFSYRRVDTDSDEDEAAAADETAALLGRNNRGTAAVQAADIEAGRDAHSRSESGDDDESKDEDGSQGGSRSLASARGDGSASLTSGVSAGTGAEDDENSLQSQSQYSQSLSQSLDSFVSSAADSILAPSSVVSKEQLPPPVMPAAPVHTPAQAAVMATPACGEKETGSSRWMRRKNQKSDMDLEAVVRTVKPMHSLADKDPAVVVPLDHEGVKGLLDWDRRRRAKRGRRTSNASGSEGGGYGSDGDEVLSQTSGSGSQRSTPSSSGKSLISLNSRLLLSQTGSGSELISALIRMNSAKTDRETRWRICKFAEILMSEQITATCGNMKWKLSEFKKFNKLASAAQGRIAQNLAMTCHFNAPPGFVRVSDWALPDMKPLFDQAPERDIPMVVKGVVSVVGAAEMAAATVASMVPRPPPALKKVALMLVGGRRRYGRRSNSGGGGSSFGGSTFGGTTIGSKKSKGKKGQPGDPPLDPTAVLDKSGSAANRMFSDRVVQYLAESYVCSNPKVVLDDAELSYNGRVGWRAIARALRKRYCSFVLPGLFVPPKAINIVHLVLTRNELDCGDAVLIADVLLYQRALRLVDLSFNRIGARGMCRMAKTVRDHPQISYFAINHNIIGPGVGKDIGLWLKKTKMLRTLSMSHNRMGEIVRYPTLYSREKIPSAVHDIFLGLRSNKSLEVLDLSYNHLGPDCCDVVPTAVNKHPKLHTLNLSGSDLGAARGTLMLFLLAGMPGGVQWSLAREAFVRRMKRRQTEELAKKAEGGDATADEAAALQQLLADAKANEDDDDDDGLGAPPGLVGDSASPHPLNPASGALLSSPSEPGKGKHGHKKGKGKHRHSQSDSLDGDQSTEVELSTLNTALEKGGRSCSLTSLSVADNQLGAFAGHALAALIERNKGLAHLDVSGNSLGHTGGMLVGDQIEYMFGIKPREFLKLVLWEIEEAKYYGRNPKKRVKIYTTLCNLNMARNGLGPAVVGSLFHSMGHANSSITSLDLSDNPLGHTVQNGGDATLGSIDVRFGLSEGKALRFLNLARTSFKPVDLVPILGGLSHSPCLMQLVLQDVYMDEPSCLQLTNAINACPSLAHLNLRRCRMGATGATLVAQKLRDLCQRFTFLDLTENYMGPVAAVYIGEALKHPNSAIQTLYLARNDLIEDGGAFVAKSAIGNVVLTDLDMSENVLTHSVAVYLADAARGLFINGKKVTDSKLRRVLLNGNPDIGRRAAKTLVKALANETVEHLELRNIGALPGTAKVIAQAVRDPAVAWRLLDVTDNGLSRIGLNEVFWAMRQNRRMRVLRCGENRAGSRFCSDEDALLRHGISVPQTLRFNVVLRELDLSYNALCTEAGVNLLDAMMDNFTLRKLSLRGNQLDDYVAETLLQLLNNNNVLEELDLGHNKLGYITALYVAEALEFNHSLRALVLDYNELGNGSSSALDTWTRSVMKNFTLQVLVLDGNKLGPTWGVRLAEAFARNNSLVQVSLRDNRLDSRAGKALFRAYKHCPYLLELALSMDEIGQELWDDFRQRFEVKRAGTAPGNYRTETLLTERQANILSSYG